MHLSCHFSDCFLVSLCHFYCMINYVRKSKSEQSSLCKRPSVQPLPEFSRIPGLILPGRAVSDCLMLMQFLRGFGKVLGLDVSVDVPTLGMLQEGLLNVGDSMGHVQDLLVRLLSLAVCDPGLPPGQKVRCCERMCSD